MKRAIRIAIDGHSSCGKSTFARAIADRLGYTYIDTGAMYRTVTLAMLREEIVNPEALSPEAQEAFMLRHRIHFLPTSESGAPEIALDGQPVGLEIRKPDVAALVSRVAALPVIRRQMVHQQQILGRDGGVVMDGRDIGTVVFPDAELKIFMTATPEIRAQRRYAELQTKGIESSYEEVLQNIEERDHIDQTRACNPMRPAEDALMLDNSEMTPEQQMEWVMPIIQRLTT